MANETAIAEFTGPDRIIIRLDPGGPIDLMGLADSFAALARYYQRHYRPHPEADNAPKLFISKLENGSVIAEIVPFIMLLGMAVPYMDTAIIVADFTQRLGRALKAFAGEGAIPLSAPAAEDAADIREFVKPLAGRKGASLGIKHAKLTKRDGEKETVVEYVFDETEINRAAVAIEQHLELAAIFEDVSSNTKLHKEVMMFFQQASRLPGKEAGRTGDKGIIPEISRSALPVYFREGFNDLKEQMIRGEINPLTSTFVVDVIVQYVGGTPRGYMVSNVHRVIAD